MIATFTFRLSDMSASLGPHFTEEFEWSWYGRCKAAIHGEPWLNRLEAELSVTHIATCEKDIRSTIIAAGGHLTADWLQEGLQEISTAVDSGESDAWVMTYWPQDKAIERSNEFLGITVGLRWQKYERFSAFLLRHFGRPDLIGTISCTFYGFVESTRQKERFPNKTEFVEGRPYFAVNDHSVAFRPIREVVESDGGG